MTEIPLSLVLIWVLVGWGLYRISLLRSKASEAKAWAAVSGFWKDQVPTTSWVQPLIAWKWFTKPGKVVKALAKKEVALVRIEKAGRLISLEDYWRYKQLVWSLGLLLMWLYLFFGTVSWGLTFKLLLMIGFAFWFIDMWLRIKWEHRERELRLEIPYFIDMVALTLDTGLNLEQVFELLVQGKQGTLNSILGFHLRKLKLGSSLESVLTDIRKEICMSEFDNFITSILQSKKLGVPLSQTLKIQSELIRTRRRQRAEELSRTAAVKISIPLVFFIFPALLIIYIGPGILRLMSAG